MSSTAKVSLQHIIVRVRSEEGRTVSSHLEIIKTRGVVLFAKIGKGISSGMQQALNDQIDKGVPTYFFMATFDGWDQPFSIYQANLAKVHDNFPDGRHDIVPSYLNDRIGTIETWFELTSLDKVHPDEVKRIHILSSGKEGWIQGRSATLINGSGG
jgi:hypothetical protein